jgi:hypothetical protein
VQRTWSTWARLRYAREFDDVAAFCLFVGYPRSGHSLVGAFLNAHKHAVVSHELNAPPLILSGCTRDELYARILARAGWFNLRGNASNYPYQIPNQWQGRFEALRLVGDKRGGAVTRCIADHPGFLEIVRELVRAPLRLVHVVRNPYDNIAAISLWHHMPLEESIDFYFRHCDTVARLNQITAPGEVFSLRHEDVIRDPASALSRLCDFVQLERYPGYLDDCSSVVFESPTYTRRRVDWGDRLSATVEARLRSYPALVDYTFD